MFCFVSLFKGYCLLHAHMLLKETGVKWFKKVSINTVSYIRTKLLD